MKNVNTDLKDLFSSKGWVTKSINFVVNGREDSINGSRK